MPEYDNTNTLTVNKNDKGDNPKRPDFRVDLNIDGVRYFGSLWKRSGSRGDFLSGPIEKADEKYQPGGASDDAPAEEKDGEDYFG